LDVLVGGGDVQSSNPQVPSVSDKNDVSYTAAKPGKDNEPSYTTTPPSVSSLESTSSSKKS
jgi:hypothetical protein